jgi:hypothetical protein
MRGSERFVKEHAKLVDASFDVLDNWIEPLEFLYVNLPLTPH